MKEEKVNVGKWIEFDLAKHIDYVMASVFSTLINKPTKYKGKGRPKKSDYAEWEHPFDKAISRELWR
jgi:hypothetical protein